MKISSIIITISLVAMPSLGGPSVASAQGFHAPQHSSDRNFPNFHFTMAQCGRKERIQRQVSCMRATKAWARSCEKMRYFVLANDLAKKKNVGSRRLDITLDWFIVSSSVCFIMFHTIDMCYYIFVYILRGVFLPQWYPFAACTFDIRAEVRIHIKMVAQ